MNIRLRRLVLCSILLSAGGLMLIGVAALLAGPSLPPDQTIYLPIVNHRYNTRNFAHGRFGAAASSTELTRYLGLQPYDLSWFNLGWYLDWGVNTQPPEPYGIEYVQVIRLMQTTTPPYYALVEPASWGELAALVQARPNDLYMVGNEPDSPFQDNMCPAAYVSAYHDVYAFIKGISPSTPVGIGGIVQPTPVRFRYLDTIWNTYQISYSQRLPTDFWNIHAFILNETGGWGAFIPPCTDPAGAVTIGLDELDRMDIFISRLQDFRQWMAAKGEREKPLYITEYGILFPEDYGYPNIPRVRDFMYATFDYFLGPQSISPTIGYPRDNNHLVQRWIWFSLAHDPYYMGGALFDPRTTPPTLTTLGQAWIDYVQQLTPTVNLMPYNVIANVPPDPRPVTATIQLEVINNGGSTISNGFYVTLYDQGGTPVSSQMTQDVRCCGRFNVVTLLWPNLPPGIHTGHIRVDPDNRINETNESDNEIEVIVTVLEHYTRLPLIAR